MSKKEWHENSTNKKGHYGHSLSIFPLPFSYPSTAGGVGRFWAGPKFLAGKQLGKLYS